MREVNWIAATITIALLAFWNGPRSKPVALRADNGFLQYPGLARLRLDTEAGLSEFPHAIRFTYLRMKLEHFRILMEMYVVLNVTIVVMTIFYFSVTCAIQQHIHSVLALVGLSLWEIGFAVPVKNPGLSIAVHQKMRLMTLCLIFIMKVLS